MKFSKTIFKSLVVVVVCHVIFLYACNSNDAQSDQGNNVILLTLDGVRWQEVFRGTDSQISKDVSEPVIFKNMARELASSGLLLGNRDQGGDLSVSNPDIISLPAYQSIMAGSVQNCHSNGCPRIPVETLQERILRERNLQKTQVATFASWDEIALASEHIQGSTLVNTGIVPFDDGSEDETISDLNTKQKNDAPVWGESRKDQYTFSQALYFLKKHQPRFLYISLNDSDEWAHHGKYPEYIQTLKQYDEWIESLLQTLREMGAYGKSTTLIVTTDHGRGNEGHWTDHGAALPEAKYIWMYAVRLGMKQSKAPKEGYSHIDIRPTIESILNLKPIQCDGCGKPIPEIVSISDRSLD